MDGSDGPARPDRPHMPGYGLLAADEGGGLLPWSFVSRQMEEARNYWVVTVGPGSHPHASPVWGLWHKEAFYFAAGAESRKVGNLKRNPALLVHLESGDEVVILEGRAIRVEETALQEDLSRTYRAKYGVDMSAGLVFGLRPRKVLAWREADFPRSATRWRLEE